MKFKMPAMLLMALFVAGGMSSAANDTSSLGNQTGQSAREVKDTVEENYKSGALKVGEASRKMEADAKDTLKDLQQQWDVLAKQLQEKTQQIQKQLEQQWQDFQKSFNKPKP